MEEPAFPAESPVEPSPAPDAAKERPADAQNGPIGEYTTPSQKAPLRSLLRRRAAIEKRCAAGAWLTELSLIICGILPQAFAFFQGEGASLTLFSADQKLYLVIHLCLLAGVCLMTLPVIRSGLRALCRLKCTADSGAQLPPYSL